MQARLKAIGQTEVVVRSIVIHGVANAKHEVPRKTGNLGRTIRPGRITKTSGEIIAGGQLRVGYARPVELGSKPHIIRPKAGRSGRNGRPAALAWGGSRTLGGRLRAGGGPTHFARVVHHPGSKGHPFLVPGLQKAAKEQGIGAIVKLWNDAA
jgi:hypothetical protein